MRKRLLQINATLNIGSTGRIEEQIAEKASLNGWECYSAHGGRYIGDSKFNTVQISSKIDNYLHAFEGEYLGRHGLGSTISTKRFIEKVKQLKPDIIHLHNIHGYFINYKLLFEYLAEAKIPVVWTLHDCWSFTGHCTHFESYGCGKWKTECARCPLPMAQYKTRLVDRSKKNFHLKKALYEKLRNVTIVPVSNWLANYVSMSILSQFTVKVIHNGIDINAFQPINNNLREELRIPSSKPIILGVVGSGFDVEKGRREFIRLSSNESLQVVLVGLTDKDAIGLPNNIIKIGRTSSQSELAKYYTAADVLLNPTYNDTFPTTNIEALACGTPVITYKTGGSPETLDERTGIIVERGDENGLLYAIDTVLGNGKASYSKRCRERAVKYYNKEERFLDYVMLYEQLIQKEDCK